MKLYNRELEEIENQERYNRVEGIAKRQIEFLVQNYGLDEKKLQNRLRGLAVIERRATDKTIFTEYRGKKQEVPNIQAAAFVTMKSQEYDGTKWSFENGIYMSDTNGEHNIIHELFHFFSKKQEMEFDENGIGYTKSGTSILGYDREDKIVDSSLHAEGLNEGITEFLAAKMDGTKPNNYYFQTYLADILISNQHSSLLEAYFSNDEKYFNKFLEEFDKNQTSISSKKLVELSKQEITVDTELLKGCLEYSLSFCNNIDELKVERKRLLPIFMDIANNRYLDFDIEDFDVKKFFNDILLQKRQNIEAKTNIVDSQTLLNSAIKATEETTRAGVINAQVGNIREVAKVKDEKSKETEIE